MEARAVRGVFLAIASLWASSVPASGADRSLTGPGSVVEGKERGEPKVFHVVAKVEIGPTGDITRVIPDLALGREVGGAVERAVRALSFTPATVDDKPAAGTTFVRMMGCAVPLEQDGFRLAFAYTSHGPGYSKLPHPTYPAAALRIGATGHFEVQVTLQPDGTARMDQVRVIEGGARAEKTFAESIKAWVAELRYEPEMVAGKAVPTSMSIPLEFGMEPFSRKAWRAEQKALRDQQVQSDACQVAFGRERTRPSKSVALNSPFVLKEGG